MAYCSRCAPPPEKGKERLCLVCGDMRDILENIDYSCKPQDGPDGQDERLMDYVMDNIAIYRDRYGVALKPPVLKGRFMGIVKYFVDNGLPGKKDTKMTMDKLSKNCLNYYPQMHIYHPFALHPIVGIYFKQYANGGGNQVTLPTETIQRDICDSCVCSEMILQFEYGFRYRLLYTFAHNYGESSKVGYDAAYQTGVREGCNKIVLSSPTDVEKGMGEFSDFLKKQQIPPEQQLHYIISGNSESRKSNKEICQRIFGIDPMEWIENFQNVESTTMYLTEYNCNVTFHTSEFPNISYVSPIDDLHSKLNNGFKSYASELLRQMIYMYHIDNEYVYTDFKPENILYKMYAGNLSIFLGDIGSAVNNEGKYVHSVCPPEYTETGQRKIQSYQTGYQTRIALSPFQEDDDKSWRSLNTNIGLVHKYFDEVSFSGAPEEKLAYFAWNIGVFYVVVRHPCLFPQLSVGEPTDSIRRNVKIQLTAEAVREFGESGYADLLSNVPTERVDALRELFPAEFQYFDSGEQDSVSKQRSDSDVETILRESPDAFFIYSIDTDKPSGKHKYTIKLGNKLSSEEDNGKVCECFVEPMNGGDGTKMALKLDKTSLEELITERLINEGGNCNVLRSKRIRPKNRESPWKHGTYINAYLMELADGSVCDIMDRTINGGINKQLIGGIQVMGRSIFKPGGNRTINKTSSTSTTSEKTVVHTVAGE